MYLGDMLTKEHLFVSSKYATPKSWKAPRLKELNPGDPDVNLATWLWETFFQPEFVTAQKVDPEPSGSSLLSIQWNDIRIPLELVVLKVIEPSSFVALSGLDPPESWLKVVIVPPSQSSELKAWITLLITAEIEVNPLTSTFMSNLPALDLTSEPWRLAALDLRFNPHLIFIDIVWDFSSFKSKPLKFK